MKLPANSIRGSIRNWIEKHADALGDDVLEIGSRVHTPTAWWIDNRYLAKGKWTGIDLQPGQNVDAVVDIHNMPTEWRGRFTGVLCSEVLEHVARPWVALPKVAEAMASGGAIIVTVPFCFPEHNYPSDYYRYTCSGLRLLLEDAGFRDIEVGNANAVPFLLNDHGEQRPTKRDGFIHTFAKAVKA